MATCKVIIRTGSAKTPLRHAWVYWDEGGIKTLRSDGAGILFSLDSAITDTSKWWEYNTPFTSQLAGGQVKICYSRGAKPIPDKLLTANQLVFVQENVAMLGGQPARPAVIQPGVANTLAVVPTAAVDTADLVFTLDTPKDLGIAAVMWELHPDSGPPPDLAVAHTQPKRSTLAADYFTDGLPQGTGLHWSPPSGSADVCKPGAAHDGAAAVASGKSSRERGLVARGTIDSAVTSAKLQVIDAAGNAVALRVGGPTGATGTAIDCTIGGGAASKTWDATVFFDSAVAAFGPVLLVVVGQGGVRPVMEAWFVELCGLQIALLDENSPNRSDPANNGEAAEETVIDFVQSPQSSAALANDEGRARRMIVYQLGTGTRLLDPAQPAGPANPSVQKPQMPLWIGELELVGVTRAAVTEIMIHRYFREKGGLIDPFTDAHRWSLQLQWGLMLAWDGPDNASGHAARHYAFREDYSSSPSFSAPQTVELFFNHLGQLVDADGKQVTEAGGAAPEPFNPMPSVVPFPTENRRLPRVLLSGQQRPWGRKAGATLLDTVVIELQPRLSVMNGTDEVERVRGGDGVFELRTMTEDGQAVDAGRLAGANAQLAAPPPTDPLASVPRFRVRGKDLTATEYKTLIDQLVHLTLTSGTPPPNAARATEAEWKTTMKNTINHETGFHQFDQRAVFHQRFRGLHYGSEFGMPEFGPPGGYGLGQLDPPPDDDTVWDFVANIKQSIHVLMVDKGDAAMSYFHGSADKTAAFNGLPAATRDRMFLRETVRSYNGGHEYMFEGTPPRWMLHPGTIGHDGAFHASSNPGYVDGILGTALGSGPSAP